MSLYLKQGNTFRVSSSDQLDLHDALPAENYVVNFNPDMGCFFLQKIDAFTAPPKFYGDTLKKSARILKTFLSRDSGTGVLMVGEKGSGKSLLAKTVSMEAKKLGMPTLIINSPFSGDGFNSFIQSITHPCVVLFDEFEKTYDEPEKQNAILTLLDGVYPSKKLFLLTANNKYGVNNHMHNRPGRLFYSLEFGGLDDAFIREYCDDNLINKNEIERLCQVVSGFGKFNFDMLKALVEEMNRFDESAVESLKIINAKPEYSEKALYLLRLLYKDREIPIGDSYKESFINPFFDTTRVYFKRPKWLVKALSGMPVDPEEEDLLDSSSGSIDISPDHFKGMSGDGELRIFTNGNYTVTMSRIEKKTYSYLDGF